MPPSRPLALVLLCAALAGCADARFGKAPAGAGGGAETISEAPAQGCTVDRVAAARLEAIRGVWSVPVEINGNKLRLILDTGAERTLLTEAAVARMGMPRDPQHETRTFAIGGLSTTPDAKVTSFALGGAYLPVSSVTVAAFAMPVRAGVALDGLLGADILSAFDVDLDTRSGTLALYRARDCPRAGPPWPEPYESIGTVERQRDRLLVPIALDGTAGIATLDTGAQHTAVSTNLAARAGVSGADIAQDPSIIAHGASADQFTVHVHRFRKLRIGPTGVDDPELPVVPMPEGLGDGLAGADFMAGRRLWLSYSSQTVFITRLYAAPPVADVPAVIAGAAPRSRP